MTVIQQLWLYNANRDTVDGYRYRPLKHVYFMRIACAKSLTFSVHMTESHCVRYNNSNSHFCKKNVELPCQRPPDILVVH